MTMGTSWADVRLSCRVWCRATMFDSRESERCQRRHWRNCPPCIGPFVCESSNHDFITRAEHFVTNNVCVGHCRHVSTVVIHNLCDCKFRSADFTGAGCRRACDCAQWVAAVAVRCFVRCCSSSMSCCTCSTSWCNLNFERCACRCPNNREDTIQIWIGHARNLYSRTS